VKRHITTASAMSGCMDSTSCSTAVLTVSSRGGNPSSTRVEINSRRGRCTYKQQRFFLYKIELFSMKPENKWLYNININLYFLRSHLLRSHGHYFSILCVDKFLQMFSNWKTSVWQRKDWMLLSSKLQLIMVLFLRRP